MHEIIKNAGYKEKNNKPEVHSGLALDMPSTTKQGMMKSNSAPNFLYRERTMQHRKELIYEINWFLHSTNPHQKM